ncbi:type II toxin-antitoxin system VapC family toxin [Nocardioides sp. LHD-245]|uniref:type II toxin-antitoxin system VapC family toxin n=1 Tax=Nocardioides sp. LHD-245 TaxID=3051387 RepID=UPI0027DF06CB|nr:type II toxin-antitoxin system VapC family toxin [Nocardioides sp. LHD-245]
MTLLLDTHAFYWCVRRGADIPSHVIEALHQAPRRLVSDISAFEVAFKVRLGKFPGAAGLRDRWAEALTQLPAIALPITTAHALRGGTLDWDHRDPFDRLLAAQALTEGLTLVTADAAFASVPGLSILRW